jgi:2-amino-4-hydroxy-6-hydroxymethyldihydropteridine diphosphokinase
MYASQSLYYEAVIALGANLGNTWQTLRWAVDQIALLPQTHLRKVSGAYQTAPQEVNEAQPDYLNAAVVIETQLDPYDLLEALQKIETEAGRTRARWHAARTLDLDIICMSKIDNTCGAKQAIFEANLPKLALPHPRAHERAFVLAPVCEIAPRVLLKAEIPAAQYLANVQDQPVRRISNL